MVLPKVLGGELDPVRAVELLEDIRGEGLLRRAIRTNVVVDAQHHVEALGKVREVVGCQQHDPALVTQRLEDFDDALLERRRRRR